jgi:hypothetical protein
MDDAVYSSYVLTWGYKWKGFGVQRGFDANIEITA